MEVFLYLNVNALASSATGYSIVIFPTRLDRVRNTEDAISATFGECLSCTSPLCIDYVTHQVEGVLVLQTLLQRSTATAWSTHMAV
ncbi:hypothetical protein D9758_007670 [Tetrapyrgos nigripes]|uniref:Uncharacterized protein n=1 Tax=Tetrapyrgos nigripes TaxID=182062 RepID=A0A8H5G5L4_9AGAR|nr:hypothetical protein D9758_007670 [Tetrapyrgos nigripes]